MPLKKYIEIEAYLAKKNSEHVDLARTFDANELKIPDYHALRTKITTNERNYHIKLLCNKVIALKQSASIAQFDDWFKEQCLMRSQLNANSYLSYFSSAKNTCNTIYWEVATLLFNPQTLGDMLSILLPEVTTLVTPTLTLTTNTNGQRRALQCELMVAPITTLSDAPTLDAFERLVSADNVLFDLASIAHFSFTLHQQVHTQLLMRYPVLSDSLYQHNEDFKTLQTHLLLAKTRGSSPRKAIINLLTEMRRDGFILTGSEFVGKSVEYAIHNFSLYLSAISADLNTSLLNMKTLYGKLFQTIVTELERGDCVETAAIDLQAILDNPINTDYLDINPTLADPLTQSVTVQFKGKEHQCLSPVGQHDVSILPSAMVITNFSGSISILYKKRILGYA